MLALLLAGCGGAAAGGPSGDPRPVPGGKGAIPGDFATRESGLYEHLSLEVRRCTLQVNARAGLRWLTTVTGSEPAGQSASEQVRQVQRAVQDHDKITAGELADAGWLVAEVVRQRLGGAYGWDAGRRQVELRPSGGRHARMLPMQLIMDTFMDRRDLRREVGVLSGGKAWNGEIQGCGGVVPLDVLARRTAWP
jgi:hypothetical protein